ncbi:hypothetical protein AAC387_Pa05g1353 [Persea americana]
MANNIFYPYFKDCRGAIDGTHIPAHISLSMQAMYRNRKGFLFQNCLMAYGFDMKFHYVLTGWEGSATDATVLWSALNRGDRLKVPDGKFDLVDAGCSNQPGFLTSYKGIRYYLKEFNISCLSMNAQELFNLRHSSIAYDDRKG